MLQKIIKLLSSNIVFFLITTAVILALNLTPLVLDARHAPAGRTFTLIHNNTQDFYFYQSLMNEGAHGSMLIYDPYTSEPHQTSVIFAYFAWLGKISKTFGLSYALTYHLSRFFFGFLLLLASYLLILRLKLPYPRLTYFFFIFAAPFMHTITDYGGNLVSVPYMNWWNGIDPVRRAAFLPHHMFGGLLLILSVMLIFKFINKPERKYLIWLILMGAMMAFVHTPSLLILLMVLPPSLLIYFFIYIASSKNGKAKPKISILKTVLNAINYRSILRVNTAWQEKGNRIKAGVSEKFGIEDLRAIGLLIYWFIGLFFLILMVSQTNRGFPWSQYINWEKNLQFPLDRELIGALGILFPFSLLGIYSALKSKKFEYIFSVCWLIIPFTLIPLAPKLSLSNIRLIQGVPYLPLAILAVLGIKNIESFINNLLLTAGDAKEGLPNAASQGSSNNFLPSILGGLKRSLGHPSGRTRKSEYEKFGIKIAKNSFIGLVILLFVIFTLPTLSWSLKDQTREYWPIYGNVYLDNRLNSAFDFINQNFPAKTITLATFYAGNYLPAYTNTISFIGHFGYTYNETEKENNVRRFFTNQMSADEAKDFLTGNKITLVFQGPEEKPLYNNYLYPTLLKPVYDRDAATIYKFNF